MNNIMRVPTPIEIYALQTLKSALTRLSKRAVLCMCSVIFKSSWLNILFLHEYLPCQGDSNEYQVLGHMFWTRIKKKKINTFLFHESLPLSGLIQQMTINIFLIFLSTYSVGVCRIQSKPPLTQNFILMGKFGYS